MMDAKGVRNMQSILVVVNKHNTARVASCWFIIYYRLVVHGNSNIKNLFYWCDIILYYTKMKVPVNITYVKKLSAHNIVKIYTEWH